METTDFLILGAGLSGLSAASVLSDRAIVLEQSDRPGGLVKTDCFDGYWFDRVLHLLYFDDDETETRIHRLMGDELERCPPEAWVETKVGTVRFPFQFHLGSLDEKTVTSCLMDMAELTYGPPIKRPENFEEMLLGTFGRTMCDIFFFPYNRKVWKRPLTDLDPGGFTWNIEPGKLEKAMRGALDPKARFDGYNSKGWYPRPPKGSELRGMEVLSHQIAETVPDIRLNTRVVAINPHFRIVTVSCGGKIQDIRYNEGCLSTIPLPDTLRICRGTPGKILDSIHRLKRNRVVNIALSIRGERPSGTGHWRYYSDESLIFTRLVFMHEFDPLLAPSDGWGMIAELVEPAEEPLRPENELIERVKRDVLRAGAIPDDCEIIDQNVIVVDPAYVVFSPESREVVNEARRFLEKNGVTPLGRYGRWSYNSMAQVMRDGYARAEKMLAKPVGSVLTG